MSKEREAFENHLKKMGKTDNETFSKNEDDSYQMDIIHFGWKIWQAAKAQAVPEGVVLVPIETLDECLSWAHIAKWDSPSKELENEIEHHELIIESIIESQQPSSTSDCPDEP